MTIRVHGDFDWPGLGIVAGLVMRFGAQPWRMGTDDSLAAADRSAKPLAGAPSAAPWDLELKAAMSRRGVRVEEELVLDTLLRDLDRNADERSLRR